jgi:hypothetical protein
MNIVRGADAMNTHARRAVTVRLSYGVAVKWCVALACMAYAYDALDPAATARARLGACVKESLGQRGNAADAAVATAASKEDREQVFSAAVYACSTQP